MPITRSRLTPRRTGSTQCPTDGPGSTGSTTRVADRRRSWRGLVLLAVVAIGMLSACQPALPTQVTFAGHGYGHGRGMSQWGALGYAVDHGWSTAQILDHYYGGTTSQPLGSNPAQRVFLRSREGYDLVAFQERGQLTTSADGFVGRYTAMKVHRISSTQFEVSTGTGCNGTWTPWRTVTATEVHLKPLLGGDDRANMLQLCSGSGSRYYRGRLLAVQARGTIETVNFVDTESLIRSVVGREMSPSWADAGSGRGAAALRAQAVAARSYAIAGDNRWGTWATTCDDTYCQAYPGVAFRPYGGILTVYEDVRIDQAVSATAGVVRKRSDGRVPATEFSASSGGHTSGFAFPAVPDEGDDIIANPHHNWSVAITADTIETAMDVRQGRDMGDLEAVRVTARNGLGADGGRVTTAVVHMTGGDVTLTGDQLASALRLKSNWFTPG